MSTREKGKITGTMYGKEDHGILTCFVYIDFDGGGSQGFGGLALDPTVGKDYVKSLCETFDVKKLEELKGKECYALRCFEGWNVPIEGIEAPSGKRFTHLAWRRKHFPETKSPLEERREDLQHRIAHCQDSIEISRKELKGLASKYTEWK